MEMNMFITDNDINDERSVFDIAAHLFEKKRYHNKQYIFSGKMHISKPDHPVTSNLDIFRKFAADQGGVFSFDSLIEYLHRIGVGTGNLRMQMRIPDEPIFFYYESGVLMCAVTAVSILYAYELFRFQMSFRIRNADRAEPSDWEIDCWYISWTLIPLMSLIVFIMGLNM